jgi:hypothetical protein
MSEPYDSRPRGVRRVAREDYSGTAARRSRLERRRDKIVAEIERNRRGEYKVPTWVLAAVLLAIIAGWAALVIFT